jgi:hypothetical protein
MQNKSPNKKSRVNLQLDNTSNKEMKQKASRKSISPRLNISVDNFVPSVPNMQLVEPSQTMPSARLSNPDLRVGRFLNQVISNTQEFEQIRASYKMSEL